MSSKARTPVRLAIEHPPDAERRAYVVGRELHHMRNVLRIAPGTEVMLLTGSGGEHRGRLERYERDRAVVRIESAAVARTAMRIIVAAAVVKGPRMDFLVEKVAELGASELWPLLCARSVVRAPGAERLARWRRLGLAAAKQSQSPSQIEVRAPIEFERLIRAVPPDTLAVLCCYAGEPLGDVIRRLQPRAILIAIGPEGDFDDGERSMAASAGFVAAGLGPNRLRSETAAIAAVSIAAASLGGCETR